MTTFLDVLDDNTPGFYVVGFEPDNSLEIQRSGSRMMIWEDFGGMANLIQGALLLVLARKNTNEYVKVLSQLLGRIVVLEFVVVFCAKKQLCVTFSNI